MAATDVDVADDLQIPFNQIQLSDAYTRSIIYGFINSSSSAFDFVIPSIIYELVVAFYYAGEHFNYLGYDMNVISVDDHTHRCVFNNRVEMTTDRNYNTCYGQTVVDSKTTTIYSYQWLFTLDTTYSTSIGFGIASDDYDKADDAFWIHSNDNIDAKYYAFIAPLNNKFALLSSAPASRYTAFDQRFRNQQSIKLVFNCKLRTLECFIDDSPPMTARNIDMTVSYHLAISMCGRFYVQLLDFKRIPLGVKSSRAQSLVNGFSMLSHQKASSSAYKISEAEIATYFGADKEEMVLTLQRIIVDYQNEVRATHVYRVKFVTHVLQYQMNVDHVNETDVLYGIIERIILLVIKTLYHSNVVFTNNYFRDVSEFVEWIFYDESNMNGTAMTTTVFAESLDKWLAKIL